MFVDLSIQFTLVFWMPSVRHEYVLYILATLWGLSDAVWQTQINSQYCSLDHIRRVIFHNACNIWGILKHFSATYFGTKKPSASAKDHVLIMYLFVNSL